MAEFGKKVDPANERDPVTENFSQIQSIKKNQEKLDREIDDKESKTNQSFEDFQTGIAEQKKQIEAMKSDLKEFLKEAMLFIRELQHTAKTEDMERLHRVEDHWSPETWVTRNELVKMTERILEDEKTEHSEDKKQNILKMEKQKKNIILKQKA